jgi:hypothetical protein
MCRCPQTPGDAYDSGRCTAARSSAIEETPDFGPAASTSGACAARITGTRSVCGSQGIDLNASLLSSTSGV